MTCSSYNLYTISIDFFLSWSVKFVQSLPSFNEIRHQISLLLTNKFLFLRILNIYKIIVIILLFIPIRSKCFTKFILKILTLVFHALIVFVWLLFYKLIIILTSEIGQSLRNIILRIISGSVVIYPTTFLGFIIFIPYVFQVNFLAVDILVFIFTHIRRM